MECVICFSTDGKLQMFQRDMSITLKQIQFIVPELIIPESRDPVFICSTCLEEVELFFTIKKSCLHNIYRLNYYNDMLKVQSDSKFNDLKILINSDEVSAQREKDIEQDLLSSDDQEDSTSPSNDQSKARLANTKNLFKCCDCHEAFHCRSDLDRHTRAQAGERPYKCQTFQQTFERSFELNRHRLIHTGEKPYECDVCHKTFTQPGGLKRHKLIHTGEKPHECDVCHKTFTLLGQMKVHKFIHTGAKPYECDVCHKTFTRPDSLNQHKLIHTGEKPHKCNVCRKTFTQLGGLKRHELIHTRLS